MKRIRQNLIMRVPIFLLFSCTITSCSTKSEGHVDLDIPYPFPFPDSVALPFLPGIVSKDSVDFGSAFSPDGKSFYFARSENKQSQIYVTHHEGEKWRTPISASFNDTKYSEADPAFSPNGKLYFISDRPKNLSDSLYDYDIWSVSPLAEGGWSQPENVENLNSDSSEYYISFAENGNLYFASSRTGGFGEEDVYVSRWVNKQYSAPENLGATINSNKSEYDPCFHARENFSFLLHPIVKTLLEKVTCTALRAMVMIGSVWFTSEKTSTHQPVSIAHTSHPTQNICSLVARAT